MSESNMQNTHSPYTPTTKEVRDWWTGGDDGLLRQEFDRWLEQHDIELMKEARNAYKKLEQAISDMQFKLPDGSDNVQLSYIIDEMHRLASAVHAWEGDYDEETK